jgi:hypothetical protein
MSELAITTSDPDLGHNLRVKTEFCGISASQHGLLTPISANYDQCRSSVSSSTWSFLSQASSSGSHPSSVSSFHSTQEPTTPPNHTSSAEYAIVGSDLSVSSASSGDGKCDFKENSFDQTLSLPSHASGYYGNLVLSSNPDWSFPYRQSDAALRPQHAINGMMPAAVDFSTDFEASLIPRAGELGIQTSDYFMPYSTALAPAFRTRHALCEPAPRNDSYAPYNMQFSSPSSWVDASTIVPTQTIVDVPAAVCTPGFSETEFHSPASSGPKESVLFHNFRREIDVSDLDLDHKMDFSDHSPSRQSYKATYFESKTGSKVIKKQKKPPAVSRRNKGKSAYSQRYKGRDLKIPIDLPSNRKRYECQYTHPEGDKYCGKKFQRVEHLRRHWDTHTGTNWYSCPDPECEKKFRSRADNLREHFKTHLRETSAKRNISRTFEEFYAYIRAEQSSEEADKNIAKLEKWRADGGHLQSENVQQAGRSTGNSWGLRGSAAR